MYISYCGTRPSPFGSISSYRMDLPVAAWAARYQWWVGVVCVVVESELAAPATTATAAPMAISALVLRPATVPPTAAPAAPAAGAAAAGTGAPPTGAVV